jgi:predicted Zn-ribbon and HTH transcriptional regulator
MIAWGNTTDRILLLLAEEPMTKAEICRRLNLTHDQVSNRLSQLKRKSKKFGKRIYIAEYTRHAKLGRTYLRAMYATGDKKDVEKISPMTPKERSRKAYEKVRAIRNSTVFRKHNETTRLMESQT